MPATDRRLLAGKPAIVSLDVGLRRRRHLLWRPQLRGPAVIARPWYIPRGADEWTALVIGLGFGFFRRDYAPTRELVLAALAASRSTLSDEDAVRMLQADLVRDRRVTEKALRFLHARRMRFDMDRAYRLLAAANADAVVAPPPPEMADRFALECELGHLPLADAFRMLAVRCPELPALLPDTDADSYRLGGAADAVQVYDDVTAALMARGAGGDAVCGSPLALSVARQYLKAVHDGDAAALEQSYFGTPAKEVVLSTRLGPR